MSSSWLVVSSVELEQVFRISVFHFLLITLFIVVFSSISEFSLPLCQITLSGDNPLTALCSLGVSQQNVQNCVHVLT